ncbi:MAG: hypothetical protein ACOCVR_00205 [Myxococcota bacterium]
MRLHHSRGRSQDQRGALDAILRAQHGVISHAQALEAGASLRRIQFLLESGRWQRLYRCVYRHATHPSTFEQRAVAACLGAAKVGVAVTSGVAAGRIHGLDGAVPNSGRRYGFDADGETPIHVTATRRARVCGVKVFVDPRLGEEDITVTRGVPVMSVARTIVDLARRCPRWRTERALDDALRRGLTSLDEVEAAADRARSYGHPSLKTLRRIVAARKPEDSRTESRLEQRVMRSLRLAGLPMPVPQHPVAVGGRTLHLDLAYPEARLGIEVDGFEFHRGRRAFDVDRRRANALLLAGWTIIRVTSEMSGEEVATVVRRSLSL